MLQNSLNERLWYKNTLPGWIDEKKTISPAVRGSVNRPRLEKNQHHEIRRVQFLKRSSAKFVQFYAKFRPLNVQIRNNFKNIRFIACKWSKIYKYYVNSMVISCNTCIKEEIECTWFKYLIYAVCRDFKFVVIRVFFSAKSVFPK